MRLARREVCLRGNATHRDGGLRNRIARDRTNRIEVLVEQRDTFEHGRFFLGKVARSAPAGVRAVNLLHVPRAVACPDKFRASLSAAEATAAIASGLERAGFDDVVSLPLAEGGEGTIAALLAARGG